MEPTTYQIQLEGMVLVQKSSFPAWLTAILGGFTYLLLGLVIELTFPDHWAGSPARLLGLSYAGWSRLLWLPVALLLLGLRATYRHLAHALGKLGKIGYWLTVAGFTLDILGSVIEFWLFGVLLVPFMGSFTTGSAGSQLGYTITSFGSLIGIAGLVIFGGACLAAPLPRLWRLLPSLIALVALSIFYFFLADLMVIHAFLYGAIWVIAGFYLKRDT